MRKITIAMLGIFPLFVATIVRAGSSYEDAIESKFRHAIVKIDVSSNTPVFKENANKESVNICKSEGTGFLVSASHVVTAEHVYALAPECGKRNIIVKSKKHNLQKLAEVVAAKDDVALLKVDSDFPAEMCALGLMAQDIYGTQAIRFGIPGGFDEPGPSVGVRIDQQGGQFSPLILLAPTIAEKGESGGPVIYLFNVVGITRARHAQYPAFSFMTVGSAIRSLMAANSVRSANICNPVEASMWTNFDSDSSGGGVVGATSAPLTGSIFASIKLDDQLTAQASAVTTDMVKGYAETFNDHSLIVSTSSGGADLSIQGKFNSAYEHREVADKTARKTNDISQQIRETLWKTYVAEGENAGKWKEAVIAPRAPVPVAPPHPSSPRLRQ